MRTHEQFLEELGAITSSMLDEDEIERLVAEISASSEEACLDNPDVNEDDVYYEVMMSILATTTPETKKEVRARLGF